jgi:hypothetical protein
VVTPHPTATLVDRRKPSLDGGALGQLVKAARRSFSDQRPVVATHPRAFELDPNLPDGHTAQNRQAPRNRLTRYVSYTSVNGGSSFGFARESQPWMVMPAIVNATASDADPQATGSR